MPAGTWPTWIKRHIAVRQRLERICTGSLLFLLVATTKHALTEAARFSGLPPSLFAQLLQSHANGALTTLEHLSKTPARQFAKARHRVHGLPWKIVIFIDATLQHGASLHPENTQTFNHGKGYGIGHQWTNVVLVLGDILMPLTPMPFESKRDCQRHNLAYQSEHERVVAYLRTLDLEDDIGAYDQREVLVVAESGYDHTKIENALANKGWHGILALGKTRSVKAEALALSTPHRSRGATLTRFFVVIAGSSGIPCVCRRVGTNASAWTVAFDTPRAPCAM